MTILHRWLNPIPLGDSDLQDLRSHVLTRVLRTGSMLGAPLVLLVLVETLRVGSLDGLLFASLLYTGLLVLTFLRRLPYSVKAHGLLAIVFFTGLLRLIAAGLNAEGGLVFAAYVLLATLLFGLKRGLWAGFGVLAVYLVVGFGMRWALIPKPGIDALPDSTMAADWVLAALAFSAATITLGFGLHTLFEGLNALARRRDSLAEEFAVQYADLQASFSEQTQTLDKRTLELEAASTVAYELAQETRLDSLLVRAPELIYSLFGYDHTGIFLLDEKEEYAVLQGTNSEGGRRLLAQGHRLRRGEESIVGHVVVSGQPRISVDVTQDAVHTVNLCLPDTRSEIALPLKIGDRIIGVLDVQSSEAGAFGQEGINLLQTIADQLAVAIARARQIQQLQARMDELESTARQYTRRTWQSYLGAHLQAYGYNAETGELTDHAILSPEAEQAIRAGEPVVHTETDSTGSTPATNVAVPVRLRDQILGVLTVRFAGQSVSPEMLNLITATTERMALSLETARLLEEIQVRADREHLVSDITAKVRGATNIESILQTTAVELGRKLGLRDVQVQLHAEEES